MKIVSNALSRHIYLMLEDFHWSVDIHFEICIHVVVYAKTCISPMQLFIMKLNYFLKMNYVVTT